MSDDGFKPSVRGVFGGLCTFPDRAQIPEGFSPACNDVEFRPGIVQSRPGNALGFSRSGGVTGIAGFTSADSARHVVTLSANPDSCVIDWAPTPPQQATSVDQGITVARAIAGTPRGMCSASLYGRLFFTTYDSTPYQSATTTQLLRPDNIPWQYDPLSLVGGAITSGIGLSPPAFGLTVSQPGSAGNISAGEHMFMWLLEDQHGNWTSPSFVQIFNSPGSISVRVDSLGTAFNAIAYPGAVKLRIFATTSGGSDFFNLPQMTYNLPITSGIAYIILDFQDSDLLAQGLAYAPYRTQVRAPIAMGLGSYADRLALYGTYSCYQPYLASSLAEADPQYPTAFWTPGAEVTALGGYDGTKVNDGLTNIKCGTFSKDAGLQATNWIKWSWPTSLKQIRVGRVYVYTTDGYDKFAAGLFGVQYSDDNTTWKTPPRYPFGQQNQILPCGAHPYWRIIYTGAYTPGGTTDVGEIQLLPPAWGELVGPLDQDFQDATLSAWAQFTAGAGVFATTPTLLGVQESYLSILGDGTLTPGHIGQWFVNAHQSSYQDAQYFMPPGTRPGVLVRLNNINSDTNIGLRIKITGWSGAVYLDASLKSFANAPSHGFARQYIPIDPGWALFECDGSVDLMNEDSLYLEITGGDGTNALTNGKSILIDYIRIYDTRRKFDSDTVWLSGAGNPGFFDRVSSPLPIDSGAGERIMALFEQSGNYYIVKEDSIWVTSNNGQDPSTWAVDNVSKAIGGCSPNCVALGPDFAVIAHTTGVYTFQGGRPEKISQEIENTWRETIDVGVSNAASRTHLIWAEVDPSQQIIEIGVPAVGGNGIVCDKIFKCDYTEGWGYAAQGRKWSIDNYQTTCGSFTQLTPTRRRMLLGTTNIAASNIAPSQAFTFGPWTGTGVTVTTPGVTDPWGMGPALSQNVGTAVAKWVAVNGASVKLDSGVSVPIGGYYWVSFWICDNIGGSNSFWLTSNVTGGPGYIAQTTNGKAFYWKRVLARFGPATAGGGTAAIVIEVLSGAGFTAYMWGAQIQAGQFYQGFTFPGAGSSGNIATPGIKADYGATVRTDWNQAVPASYTLSPFEVDAKIGRGLFDRAGIRMQGSGNLTAQLLLPDNSNFTYPASGGPTLAMSSPALNDLELKGRVPSETYVCPTVSTNAEGAWWSMARFAAWSMPSSYDGFRR